MAAIHGATCAHQTFFMISILWVHRQKQAPKNQAMIRIGYANTVRFHIDSWFDHLFGFWYLRKEHKTSTLIAELSLLSTLCLLGSHKIPAVFPVLSIARFPPWKPKIETLKLSFRMPNFLPDTKFCISTQLLHRHRTHSPELHLQIALSKQYLIPSFKFKEAFVL